MASGASREPAAPLPRPPSLPESPGPSSTIRARVGGVRSGDNTQVRQKDGLAAVACDRCGQGWRYLYPGIGSLLRRQRIAVRANARWRASTCRWGLLFANVIDFDSKSDIAVMYGAMPARRKLRRPFTRKRRVELRSDDLLRSAHQLCGSSVAGPSFVACRKGSSGTDQGRVSLLRALPESSQATRLTVLKTRGR